LTPLLAAILVALGWLPDPGWVVIDPSGESREVILVVGDRAYLVQTTPLVDEDPPPPPPPDDPSAGLGFAALVRANRAPLTLEERIGLASLAGEYALRATQGEWPTATEAAIAWDTALDRGQLKTERTVPLLSAVDKHWGTLAAEGKLVSASDAARAFREIQAGLAAEAAR